MSGTRGFALLAVLGLLVALAALALGVGLRLRVARLGVANAAEHAEALAAAQATIAELRAALADPRAPGDAWEEPLDAKSHTAKAGTASAVLTLRDLGARLNLNRASEDELRRLFVALRIDAGEADRLAQTLADWRDADDLRRPRGAERDDYAKRSAATRPRNGSFDRVSELSGVLGVTPERYALIRPHVAVHGTGRINVNAAERPVLLGLPGMTDRVVKLLQDRRVMRRPVRSLSELQSLLPSGAREALLPRIPELDARVVFETREIEAVSVGRLGGSPVEARVTALLARVPEGAIVTWRQVE